jgi:hypothetical protein
MIISSLLLKSVDSWHQSTQKVVALCIFIVTIQTLHPTLLWFIAYRQETES